MQWKSAARHFCVQLRGKVNRVVISHRVGVADAGARASAGGKRLRGGEGIFGAFAGVENGQIQRWRIFQRFQQARSAHRVTLAKLIFEQKPALPGVAAEV